MGKYFGTDGIRGIAGKDLDAELACKTGSAAATVLNDSVGERPRVIIARDTRVSGDMLVTALSAGLCSAGANVTLLGVLPTPAVAYLTAKTGASMGIVISASHNPFEHNGIKLFSKDGFKLSDTLEGRIEHIIDSNSAIKMTGGNLGVITEDNTYWKNEYVQSIAAAARGRYGNRVAIDCANGAASETARMLLSQLGVEFEIFFDEPDGVNINAGCGSTDLRRLREIMKTGKFGVGFAFDGDADRCLAVDESGGVIDGDMMLAVFARYMRAGGSLKGDAMVGTVVSNSGMEVFSRNNGFTFHRAAVGDKNVLEMMRVQGCNLGGESSGHIIFSDDARTGDGQLTAVKFLNVLAASCSKASELVSDIPKFPQVMPSYTLTGGVTQRDAIMAHPKLSSEVARQQDLLAGEGRILVRPSGTEPIIRVLVEAKTEELALEKAEILINVIKSL
ncbi:MAG: phosphoglucosamine mutase [Oscillospiraceae bacterium]|nr:phosphoglucosamine mutase [Oscillospiraceae bacterium]